VWHPSSVATIKGAAFNKVNTVCITKIYHHLMLETMLKHVILKSGVAIKGAA